MIIEAGIIVCVFLALVWVGLHVADRIDEIFKDRTVEKQRAKRQRDARKVLERAVDNFDLHFRADRRPPERSQEEREQRLGQAQVQIREYYEGLVSGLQAQTAQANLVAQFDEMRSDLHRAMSELPLPTTVPRTPLTPFQEYAIEAIPAERLTVDMIVTERNTEVRRRLMEKYGFQRFMERVGAGVIARDTYGELLNWNWGSGRGNHVAVKVINSSPEPDGTFKTYILPVPPDMKTPREAIAWTFGMQAHEYKPKVMT